MAAGYVQKRSDTCWLARIEHNSNGRRRYFSKSFKTEKEPTEHLQNQQSDKNRGVFVEPSKVILSTLAEEWFGLTAANVTERTADGYKGLMDRYVFPTLGNRLVSEITTREIQKLYADMLAGKHPKTTTKSKHPKVRRCEDRRVGARVVRHTHAALRQVLEQAVEWKLIIRNPADSLKRKLPKVVEVERRVLDEAEAGNFLKSCATKTHGLIFEFALLSGMRPEEYLAMQWKDLDFERNTIQVRRVLVRHKKAWRFQEPKTKGSRRTLTIPASLSRKLAIHKRIQAEHRLKIGSEWEAHDLVFCGTFGTPLSIPNITYRYFRPILIAAKLPQIRLYDVRHSHATLLLIAGEHLKVVSERLGHSTIRLTADTYSHVLEGMQQGTASKLEKRCCTAPNSNRQFRTRRSGEPYGLPLLLSGFSGFVGSYIYLRPRNLEF